MKLLISTTVVLVFSLYMAPAMAFDNGGSVKGPVSFPAFSHMSAVERTTLTPLTDTELASVEGATLAGFMAAIQEAISSALLKAQTGTLGCNASCMAQIMTRLALSPTGATPLVAQQTSSPNEANRVATEQMSSPTKANIAVIKQSPPPNGGTNNAIVQQSIR